MQQVWLRSEGEERVNNDEQAQFAAALASIGDMLAPLGEAVEGYRAAREREGYGDALARKMAADYHAALLKMLTK